MKRDLSTRILALALALFLWGYVRMTHSTLETRQFAGVPIDPRPAAAGWTAVPREGTVTLSVRGTPDVLARIRPEELVAVVDPSGIMRADTVLLPVRVNLPEPAMLTPTTVSVSVQPLKQRTLPVRVSFLSAPQPGTTVGEYVLLPTDVALEGPADALDSVKYVTVLIDPSESLTEARDFVPKAVNAVGERVTDVKVLTSTVRVHQASLTGEHTTRPFAVRAPSLINPPRGWRIAVARVAPEKLTLSGDAATLNRLDAYLDTEPVDVSDVRRDGTRDVRVKVPRGVSVVGTPFVRVDLEARPAR
jgi:YbbR domain-containing protein